MGHPLRRPFLAFLRDISTTLLLRLAAFQ